MRRGATAPFLNELKLIGIHRRMLRRIVPEPTPPPDSPKNSETAENPKTCAPSGRRDQRYRKRRSQGAAEARSHEDDAVGSAALGSGKPLREAARGIGEGPRFAGSE